MKLSINYNFFNGEEHLYNSIKNIRSVVDHISICYQTVSNLNNPISQEALDVLQRLKNEQLVDEMILYEPDFEKSPQKNEFQKRVIGVDCAKKAGATHILLADADEFYDQKQFQKAKDFIEKHDISCSATYSYFYIHKPIYRSKEPDGTNIPFICKLDEHTIFALAQDFPCNRTDPTRRVVNHSGKFKMFEIEEIVMHHMNFVRYSFDSKLSNTSSRGNPKLKRFLKKINKCLNNWRFGKEFNFPKKRKYEIIEVPNQFGIDVEFKPKKRFKFFNKIL